MYTPPGELTLSKYRDPVEYIKEGEFLPHLSEGVVTPLYDKDLSSVMYI
jgi:hypothetical protein